MLIQLEAPKVYWAPLMNNRFVLFVPFVAI